MKLFNKLNEEVAEYDLAGDPITLDQKDAEKLGDILYVGGKPTPYIEFIKKLTGKDPNSVASGQEVLAEIDRKVVAILNLGLKDLNIEDEKIDITEPETPVKALFPTQSQIGLLDSLAYCAFKLPDGAKSYLSGSATFGGGRVISCDLNGTKYILDGHHRWSAVYATNPEAYVPCFELQLSGKVKDPVEALKMIQLSIAATYHSILLKGANSETDIFNPAVVAGDMKKLINKTLDGNWGFPKVKDEKLALSNLKKFIEILSADERYSKNVELMDLSEYKNLPNVFDTDELKQKYSNVVDVLAKNLNLLIAENGKPSYEIKRAAMPQPNDTSIAVAGVEDKEGFPDDVIDKIESGELNFIPDEKEGFVPDKAFDELRNASESKKWVMTYEQFRNRK